MTSAARGEAVGPTQPEVAAGAPGLDRRPEPDAAVAGLGDQLDRWRVPGLHLAVVRDGQVKFAGGLGMRGAQDRSPVTGTTLFHHGSCAKAYTSLLAAVLAGRGVLDLDAPVRRHVPELRLPDPVVAERVTMRDLLSHRSGLGRHDLAWILNPAWSRQELVRRLEHLPLAADLRVGMDYSNLGYALAGLAIGRATGSTWEEQLAEHVLEPAGMTRTWTSAERAGTDPDRAQAHLLRGDRPEPTGWRSLRAVAPAGELATCATDAARWLLLQLGAGSVEGRPAVSAEALSATHELHVPLPADASRHPEVRWLGYSLGWVVGTFRRRPVLWHSGGVDGFLTNTLLLPEQRLGVIASANLHLSDLPFAVVLELADRLLGSEGETSWFDRLHPGTPEPAGRPDSRPAGAPGRRPPVPPPSHPLDAFTGRYTDPGYGELVVTTAGGELAVRIGACELESRHRHFDTWDLRYAQLDETMPLTFGTDPDGVVAEAVTPLDDGTPPVRFRRTSPTTPRPAAVRPWAEAGSPEWIGAQWT